MWHHTCSGPSPISIQIVGRNDRFDLRHAWATCCCLTTFTYHPRTLSRLPCLKRNQKPLIYPTFSTGMFVFCPSQRFLSVLSIHLCGTFHRATEQPYQLSPSSSRHVLSIEVIILSSYIPSCVVLYRTVGSVRNGKTIHHLVCCSKKYIYAVGNCPTEKGGRITFIEENGK